MADKLDLTQFDGHTPGEWRRCGGMTPEYMAIHSEHGYIIFGMANHAQTKEHGKPIAAPTWEAQRVNARLIAAAPQLLREVAAPQLLREVAELRAKVSELERTLALQQKSAELLFESQQALARRREKENRK
jgi:hypothetical protein